MTHPRRNTQVDQLFAPVDEPAPLPPPPIGEDPPELTARLVSALGGEVTDMGLLPQEFRMFRSEMRDTLRGITDTLKTLNERVLPLLADHSKRLDDHETRLRALEAEVTKRRKAGKR